MSSASVTPLQPQKTITHVIFDMDGLILGNKKEKKIFFRFLSR